MTFDDYILKQDHIRIEYYGKTPDKRVLSLDGINLKDAHGITYLKYNAEKDKLICHREDGSAYIGYDEDGVVAYVKYMIDGKSTDKTDPRLNLRYK